MGRFRITVDAQEDLRRIYRYGVLTFGEPRGHDLCLKTLTVKITRFSTSVYTP